MQEQQKSTSIFDDMKTSMNIVVFIARIFSVSVEVFLRRNFGARYVGTQAALAVPLMFFFSIFFPHDDPRPLLWFLGAYLLMCFRARIEGLRRRRRGEDREHSYYNGWPRLADAAAKPDERKIKRIVEPALLLAVGYLVWECTRPLGTFLMLAAGSLFLVSLLTEQYERVRAMDMNDAVIEQRQLAERFREMNGDRQ